MLSKTTPRCKLILDQVLQKEAFSELSFRVLSVLRIVKRASSKTKMVYLVINKQYLAQVFHTTHKIKSEYDRLAFF